MVLKANWPQPISDQSRHVDREDVTGGSLYVYKNRHRTESRRNWETEQETDIENDVVKERQGNGESETIETERNTRESHINLR